MSTPAEEARRAQVVSQMRTARNLPRGLAGGGYPMSAMAADWTHVSHHGAGGVGGGASGGVGAAGSILVSTHDGSMWAVPPGESRTLVVSDGVFVSPMDQVLPLRSVADGGRPAGPTRKLPLRSLAAKSPDPLQSLQRTNGPGALGAETSPED